MLIAYWGVDALVAALPDSQLNALPFLKSLHIDAGILAFSFGLSLLTGIVFGLAPALQSSRPDLNEVLKEGGRNTAGGAGHRLRSALVMTEIALGRGAAGWRRTDDEEPAAVVAVKRRIQSRKRIDDECRLAARRNTTTSTGRSIFYDQLKERVQSLPGVNGAGTVNILPLQGGNTTRFNVEGDPIPPPGQEIEANIRTVDESYFQTLGVPICGGTRV